MPMFIGSGGVWKEVVTNTAIGASSVYKEIRSMWVGSGGAWKKFFDNIVVTVSNRTIQGVTTEPATCTAQYRLENAGDITEQASPSGHTDVGDWIDPKAEAGSGYDARMSKQSGSATLAVGSEATWESLGTTRTYGISNTTGGTTADYVGLIEIRDATTLEVLDSATITLEAQVNIA